MKINLGWSTVNNMLPRETQFNPHTAECIRARTHTHTQIHIPLSCLSIVRGKHYWPISELNVSTCHAAGNPLSPPPPAFIVLSCYHAVFFFIHVAPLQEKRQSQETVMRTPPVKWSWSRPTWWLGNKLSYLKRLTCITNIIPGTICGLIEKYHLFFVVSFTGRRIFKQVHIMILIRTLFQYCYWQMYEKKITHKWIALMHYIKSLTHANNFIWFCVEFQFAN